MPLILLFSLFYLNAAVHAAKPQIIHDPDLLATKVYKLENGLTVYLSRNPQKPRFYAEIIVRCGSKNDPSDATGMAHFLEHLMFKGTKSIGTTNFKKEQPILEKISALYETRKASSNQEKRNLLFDQINALSRDAAQLAIPNEIDRIYKSIGGLDVNAHTSFEETVYKVCLPSNRLEHWAALESERFKNPIFRLFHTELETVCEEKNEAIDNGSEQVFQKIMKLLYPGHPLGESILGRKEHLENPSIKALYKHYKTYYHAHNMAIAISGDIHLEQTIATINKYFGALRGDTTFVDTSKPPIQNQPKIQEITVKLQGEESMTMAFPTVAKSDPDAPALELFDMVMDNSEVGKINRNLTQSQKVRSAGSYPLILNQCGSQHFYATPRAGQPLEQLKELILEQIELVKKGQFESSILDAIRADLKKSDQITFESNEGRVAALRDSFIANTDWQFHTQRHARYAKVTKEDIVKVANKYFKQNYKVIFRKKGGTSSETVLKKAVKPLEINPNAQSEFATNILAIDSRKMKPEFISEGKQFHIETKGNVNFISTENPINDIFSLTWHFPVGSIQDNRIGLAFDSIEQSGCKKFPLQELKVRWYEMGIHLDLRVEENRSHISITGPESSYVEGVKLFYHWIRELDLKEERLRNLAENIKLNQMDSSKEPATIVHAMARYCRFGNNSNYKLCLSNRELDSLTVPDLLDCLNRLFKQNHTVSYVGRMSPSEWQESIPILQENSPAKIQNRPFIGPREPLEIFFFHRDMTQAQIWMESNAGTWSLEDAADLEVFNEYFSGGMSGIVFQELREARGLAYSADGYSLPPRWEKDAFLNIGTISCQADKAYEAIQTFLKLFNSPPKSIERFEESKAALYAQFHSQRVEFRDIPFAFLQWRRKGYSKNPARKIYNDLKNVTIETLQAFHRDHIANKKKTICIVGDRRKIAIESLKKLGVFKELSSQDIFNF